MAAHRVCERHLVLQLCTPAPLPQFVDIKFPKPALWNQHARRGMQVLACGLDNSADNGLGAPPDLEQNERQATWGAIHELPLVSTDGDLVSDFKFRQVLPVFAERRLRKLPWQGEAQDLARDALLGAKALAIEVQVELHQGADGQLRPPGQQVLAVRKYVALMLVHLRVINEALRLDPPILTLPIHNAPTQGDVRQPNALRHGGEECECTTKL
mmetsp:Transcript_126572/g.405147  ORF Transcript_126572/g.405147 Transcript_126572/m.405147 type:complete len:213 (+) Transcript_126572:384-1022(+)